MKLAKCLFVSQLILWFLILFLMPQLSSVSATEELTVTGITRIMHPAYRALQYSYSVRNPFNLDNTKIVMYEDPTNAYDPPGRTWSIRTGRRHVVGDIEQLKRDSDSSNLNAWLTNYEAHTTEVPDFTHINRGDTAMWSKHPGEENILFVLYYSGSNGVLRKFNVNNMASVNAALDSVTLSGGSTGMIMGWTANENPPRLVILDNQDSSTGWYVNTLDMTISNYTQPSGCTQAERNQPTRGHGHSSTSPSGRYYINYWQSGSTVTDPWDWTKSSQYYTVRDRVLCNEYDIHSYFDESPSSGESVAREFHYADWSASEDWFIANDLGDGPWGSLAHVDAYGVWQVFFVPGQKSPALIRKLLFTTNTGGWRTGEANWNSHPFPFISSDRSYIMFTSTDGKFTYEDRSYSINWGLEGVLIADVTSASGSQTCTSFTYTAWGECQPNNTQTRTVTSSSPSGCTGGNPVLTQSCTYTPGASTYNILKTNGTPTIDGNLGEYALANPLTFSSSSGGNTVTVRTLWSSEALYLGINVTDTQLNASVTTTDGSVWSDDSVEWFIDTYNDGGGSTNPSSSFMLPDDYHGIVNILNAKYDSQGTTSSTPTGSWNGTWQSAVKLNGTNNNNTDNDTGYTIEIKIPWTSIGYSSAPSQDALIGMSFALNDKDAAGTNSIMMSDITSGFENASNWQSVLLSGTAAFVDATPPAPPMALMIQ